MSMKESTKKWKQWAECKVVVNYSPKQILEIVAELERLWAIEELALKVESTWDGVQELDTSYDPAESGERVEDWGEAQKHLRAALGLKEAVNNEVAISL